jgi:hypothetical protein
MIMGISIPLALLLIVIVIILAMFCCCPHLLCCYADNRDNRENRENRETKQNRRDQLEQESAYTQTKSGYKPFVPTIRKTSPQLSQTEEYAAPIRPPLRRKFYHNRFNFHKVVVVLGNE